MDRGITGSPTGPIDRSVVSSLGQLVDAYAAGHRNFRLLAGDYDASELSGSIVINDRIDIQGDPTKKTRIHSSTGLTNLFDIGEETTYFGARDLVFEDTKRIFNFTATTTAINDKLRVEMDGLECTNVGIIAAFTGDDSGSVTLSGYLRHITADCSGDEVGLFIPFYAIDGLDIAHIRLKNNLQASIHIGYTAGTPRYNDRKAITLRDIHCETVRNKTGSDESHAFFLLRVSDCHLDGIRIKDVDNTTPTRSLNCEGIYAKHDGDYTVNNVTSHNGGHASVTTKGGIPLGQASGGLTNVRSRMSNIEVTADDAYLAKGGAEGVFIDSNSHVEILNVTCRNVSQGVRAQDGMANATQGRLTIDRLDVDGFSVDAISIRDLNSGTKISNCNLRNGTKAGMFIRAYRQVLAINNLTIINNTVENCAKGVEFALGVKGDELGPGNQIPNPSTLDGILYAGNHISNCIDGVVLAQILGSTIDVSHTGINVGRVGDTAANTYNNVTNEQRTHIQT